MGGITFSLMEDEYQKIVAEYGFNSKDFWLFDNENLLIFNYTRNGQFASDIAITSRGMIERYCDLRDKLLQRSIPMELFIKKSGVRCHL